MGYHVIPHDRKEKQAHVKKFIPAPRSSDSLKPVLKKTNLHLQQYASGVFVNSEYITNEPSRMSHSRYSRKNVEQAQQKYQSSQGVQ